MSEEKRSVVVVEDEEDVRSYLTALFTDMGFKVRAAENGAKGAELVKAEKPDLITMDVVMPEKTGVKLYRELRGNPETAGIPIIIVTGLQQDFENFIHHRRSAPPPDGYVTKPFDKATLLAEVEKVLNVKLNKAVGA